MFSLKQKTNQILSATLDKIKFCLFKKAVYGSFRQEVTMEKCKTKAIQADVGIFTHILAYPDIHKHKQASETLEYLEPWSVQNEKHIHSLGIFRTLAYSEHWCIQNSCIFATLAYSGSYQTSTIERFRENI